MLPKWMIPKGKYILKIKRKNAYLQMAGSRDEGNGESWPAAQTTLRKMDAQGFSTMRQAEAMSQLVADRYGLETHIVERQVRRNDA